MLRLLQHPVLLVVLCFSLIGTPVTYRGGASNPHPHTFIEFLMEAESGHFDHHHHHGDEDDDGPESGTQSPATTPTHPVVVQDVPVLLWHGERLQQDTKVLHYAAFLQDAASDRGDNSSQDSGLKAQDQQFRASISAFVVSDVGQLALILPQYSLPQSSRIDTAFVYDDRTLRGITHSPIAPPPR